MKYRLGDICTITKGETGIMRAIPGPYTMVALGEENKTHNEFQFDTKAVIIPLVSSTGHGHASMKRVKYQEGKFAVGSILCAVIPKDERFVLAKYLHIYLNWNREELLVSQMKGMANVSLPMNKIADVLVTVPGIAKQKEIIELEKKLVEKELEADKLYASQLTLLENLNQAILQEAVQGKLVPQNPNDEPATKLLKRIKTEKATLRKAQGKVKTEKPLTPIKPSEIPFEIPESWVWCRLGEIAKNVEYGTSQKAEMTSEHIPVLRMNNIQSGKIDCTNLKYVSNLIDDLPKLFLVDGDMLFNRTNSYELVGKTAIYRGTNNSMTFASYLIRVQYDENVIPEFVSNYVNSPICRETQLEPEIIQQNGQANFNGTKLQNILFPLPPLPEQTRIVAEIEKQLAKTKQLKEHIIASQQATEQLLKALLHQAFEVKETV
jgi:type I restriction enzyme S subunit